MFPSSLKSTNQRKIPYLLFAKPSDKSFRLFAYGEVGLEILEKIKEIYPNEFYLKEQKFTVQKLVLNEPESIRGHNRKRKLLYGRSHLSSKSSKILNVKNPRFLHSI